MRQRQPDGADLLPAGQEAVDDATRDDEMRARVVVAQRQAGGRVEECRRAPDQERRDGDGNRNSAVTVQVS